MSSEEKKKRGKNFTAEEEQVLMELLEERKNILENKKSDAATWKQKEQAWEEMADTFYTRTGIRREWKALRDKFINMKRRSKVELGEDKTHSFRMGTGKFIALMGDSTAGLSNQFDSDASNVPNDINFEGEDDMFASSTDTHDVANISAHKEVMANTSADWPSWNPRTLRSLDEEKIKLVLLQQDFYKGENLRAQEKHDHEMLKEKIKLDQEVQEGKLRIEMMELEILEKRARLDLK
ncbi:myb/SANT-like DNA-binding domain-containing protein 4 [Drosophila montana]|uniref:myb/SANT-like DNA-binding domain-containing protein 4 n=1 Tax=Drosophila montana TaxID=40370 RepID=UPI00313AAEDA